MFLTGLLVLGAILVYGTLQARSGPNYYLLGLGILLMIPSVIVFFYEGRPSQAVNRISKLSDLKFTGIAIPVDLTQCKILSNRWTVRRPEQTNKTILYNELSGNSYENRKTSEVTISKVRYRCIVNGKQRIFTSSDIGRDKQTLMLLLETQKETNIYIDRDEPKYYYFDLEFLESNKD